MNFGNKHQRNPNTLGNKQQFRGQLGNKMNYGASLSRELKKPDISEGIVNESNNHDVHHEPMGLNNVRKQPNNNLEKVRKSKLGRFV